MPRAGGMWKNNMAMAMRDERFELSYNIDLMLDSSNIGPSSVKTNSPKSDSLVLQTVRQYFPETWLWNIHISKYNN